MKNGLRQFALLTVMLWASLFAFASDAFEVGGIYYRISGSTDVEVTAAPDKDHYSGAIDIPERVSYGGTTYSVTSIGSSAFSGCGNLTSIIIPSTVTTIHNYAFNGCVGLKEVKLADGPAAIHLGINCSTYNQEKDLFRDCPLETVYLGRNMYYPTSYNSRYSSDYSYRFAPFFEQKNMTSLTIGKYMTFIGEWVCYSTSLKSIVSYSYNIEGVESWRKSRLIPVVLKSDSGFAGIGNINLTSFDQITLESDGREYALVKATHRLTFDNCLYSEGNYYILPLDRCFAKAENVKALFRDEEITEQLTSDKGFEFTPSVHPSDNIFSVYGSDDDPSLTRSVALDKAGTLFDKLGLQHIEKIEYLAVSGDIDGTDIMTINRMASLKYLDLSKANIVAGGSTYRENLKTEDNIVGTYFFSDINLEVVILPNTATSINTRAFENSKTLRIIKISDSITTIGYLAFYGCSGLTSVIVPDSVDYIDSAAFQACDGMKHITIGNSVTYIGYSAFRDCTALISVDIPDSVTKLSDHAFRGCSSLSSVTIGRSLDTISPYVFYGCSSLNTITIPNTVTTIGYSAFYDCTGLTSVSIPNSVTKIGGSAFNGCKSLVSVTIPASVTIIDSDVFRNCSSLTSVTLPNSITSIEYYVFSGCSSLTSIAIPESVTSIGEGAFYGAGLTEIVIPEAVTLIGKNAFARASGLVKIYSLNTTPPVIDSSTFDSAVESAATLYVPKGSLVYYWLDPVWKAFVNMSDDLLCLQAIPDATYGDGEIDLALYAPEGVELTYATSNDDVVRINGTKMQIVGAGTATVGAALADSGTPMTLMRQMRQFVVGQADLTVTVEDVVIEQGQPLPGFTYRADGLKYDDSIDDIDNIPQPVCDVDEHSPAGEYAITFTGGSDRNYRINTVPAKVIVKTVSSSVESIAADSEDQEIEVYQPNGIMVYKGLRSGLQLQNGIYLIRQGEKVEKIAVK